MQENHDDSLGWCLKFQLKYHTSLALRVKAFLVFFLFSTTVLLFASLNSFTIAAGVTPGILEAAWRLDGLASASFCRSSIDKLSVGQW